MTSNDILDSRHQDHVKYLAWYQYYHVSSAPPDGPCQAAGPAAEKTACFISEAQAADREVNAFYAQVRRSLSPEQQRGLQVAQRLWVQFRDASCGAERSLHEGGSAAPMVYAACVAADTGSARQNCTPCIVGAY